MKCILENKSVPKIVIICGPTSVGKTKFAIDIAEKFSGEIVSADSMQVYCHMNIGTAKPTASERKSVYHHMIDIVDPSQDFDVASYVEMARTSIKVILDNNHNVFLVGGSGLYIKALIHGLFDKVPGDVFIRNDLRKKCQEYGSQWLHSKLSIVDYEAANRIHKNDTFRIIRALEVFKITGTTITELQDYHKKKPSFYKTLVIGLYLPKLELYEKINNRVENMIGSGFVDEVRDLLNAGYLPTLKAMNSLGYRHILDFLKQRQSWNETMRTLKRDHRRYAKRQLTWFNADSKINWLRPNQLNKAKQIINIFLK